MTEGQSRFRRARGAVASAVVTGALFSLTGVLPRLLAQAPLNLAGPFAHRVWLVARALAWVSAAFTLHRALHAFFWPRWERSGGRGAVPGLVRDFVSGLGGLLAVAAFLAVDGRVSITPIWATSGAISVVLGIALKEVILDLFGVQFPVGLHFRSDSKGLARWAENSAVGA